MRGVERASIESNVSSCLAKDSGEKRAEILIETGLQSSVN
jgi:hypothetical protein